MKRTLPAGYEAEYTHLREYDANGDLLAKGGRTVVQVTDAHGNTVAAAVAKCHPNENYNKALGRTVALGQALAALDGTLTERALRRELRNQLAVGYGRRSFV